MRSDCLGRTRHTDSFVGPKLNPALYRARGRSISTVGPDGPIKGRLLSGGMPPCVPYGAGLRVSEVVALKVGDVDPERMLLRVERGNGPRIVTRCCRRSCSNCCAPCGRRVGGATCCCREVTSIPRPRFNCAAVGPPALPRCPCRCPGRGDVAAHAAPQLHHPPLRARCRDSRNSHTSGPCQTRRHAYSIECFRTNRRRCYP